MTTTAIPTTSRPVVLPNLDELPEVLARKFRAMDPRQLADIFTPTTTEGTK